MAPRAPAGGGGLRSSRRVDGGLSLVLNNTIDAVEDGRRALLAFFEQHEVDEQAIHRLEVIFEELVSNIIRHGFKPGSDQSIHVHATTDEGLVELTVADDGAPFNPLMAPQPAPYTSLATARVGGRGIPLITTLSASVRYDGAGPAEADGFHPSNRVALTVSTPT